jgi:hypothetical protein
MKDSGTVGSADELLDESLLDELEFDEELLLSLDEEDELLLDDDDDVQSGGAGG